MKRSTPPAGGSTSGASTPRSATQQQKPTPSSTPAGTAGMNGTKRRGGIGSMFDDLLERLKMSARIFLVSSIIAFVVIFGILFYLQRPIDDVAAVSTWSPFEVEVWFRRQNLVPAKAITDGFEGRYVGHIDGEQLTMLSLNDLRQMYRADEREDDAVDVYRALQQQLRPLAPISIWFVITVMIQTGFIYGIIFIILLCWAVRWVKKKVDANPMVQQMKMLTQAMAPPTSSSPSDEKALMNPMLMNPLLNPFGPMMAMQSATAAAAMAQANSMNNNNINNTDDPTAVVDNPVAPNALMDPTAMMMANPFLFPFGPLPPPSAAASNAAAAAMMPPMFPFMPPPPGLVARAAARRQAAAAATNWTPEVD